MKPVWQIALDDDWYDDEPTATITQVKEVIQTLDANELREVRAWLDQLDSVI